MRHNLAPGNEKTHRRRKRIDLPNGLAYVDPVMVRKLVRYRVKPGQRGQVEEAVREFVRAVRNHEPRTTYQANALAEDPLSFLHYMEFPGPAGEARHREARYTRRFVEVLVPLCVEAPHFEELEAIEPD